MERFWYYSGEDIPDPMTETHADMQPKQSLGWEHYEVHEPEPHILLFK